ncbi:hypothetical protein BDZ89DRAFT_962561, partial [Hymenopellis radicata]
MLRDSNLHGIQLPGSAERLVVSLFADDTTVLLTENDCFEDLQTILDLWCKASTARFNISKTEILPFGSPQYRRGVCDTRKVSLHSVPFPPSVHIASQNEAVRFLGAWHGYFDSSDVVLQSWSATLDKIQHSLTAWAK